MLFRAMNTLVVMTSQNGFVSVFNFGLSKIELFEPEYRKANNKSENFILMLKRQ